LGRWRFVPLALALALLIAEPIQVEAHTFLVASSPAAGQRVVASPQLLQLEFTQPVVLGGTRVEIQSSGGGGIATGALQRSADGTVVTVRLPTLANGTYHVTWQALSEDGHPSTGDFVFGIGAAAVLPAVTSGTASPTDWPEALATWVVIAGLALLLGTVISRRWVWNATQITGERPSLYMVHVLVIAGTLQEFTLTAARVGAGSVAIGSAIATAVGTQAGFLALLTLAMTAGSAIGWRLRQARVAIPWILAGLVAQALRGHPGVSGEPWQESAVVIHVGVAALWVGMLAHLVGGIWLRSATWEEISNAVRRYAALALASAALVVATGIVLALGEIRQPQQLRSNPASKGCACPPGIAGRGVGERISDFTAPNAARGWSAGVDPGRDWFARRRCRHRLSAWLCRAAGAAHVAGGGAAADRSADTHRSQPDRCRTGGLARGLPHGQFGNHGPERRDANWLRKRRNRAPPAPGRPFAWRPDRGANASQLWSGVFPCRI